MIKTLSYRDILASYSHTNSATDVVKIVISNMNSCIEAGIVKNDSVYYGFYGRNYRSGKR